MKEICLFGLGEIFYRTVEIIRQKYTILYLSDNNPSTWGKEFYGIPCISPEELRSKKENFEIYVTTAWEVYKQIKKQLHDDIQLDCFHWEELFGVYPANFSDFSVTLTTEDFQGNYSDEAGNKISFAGDVPRRCKIVLNGGNHHIHFGSNIHIARNAKITIICNHKAPHQGGTSCIIGDNVGIWNDGHLSIDLLSGASCSIGAKTSFGNGEVLIKSIENGHIIIGENCMFSYGIRLMQNDYHLLFDKKTGKRINSPKDIVVGDHVWVGENVTLLHGAQIGSGCMIGYGSITSGRFDNNILLAGQPARTLRKDICWARDSTYTQHRNIEECWDKDGINIPD